MNLLAPIAPRYSLIGVGLKVPISSLGCTPLPDYNIDNLMRTLKWWLDNGNSPKVNSAVTWENIIGVIEGPIVQNFEVSETMRKFLLEKYVQCNCDSI